MPHVTLLRGDRMFQDGFVKSRLRYDGWYWDFYAANAWDPISISTKLRAIPCDSFEINEIGKSIRRKGATVAFQAVIPGTDVVGPYRLIFADENDARDFTGQGWPHVVTF